MMSETVELTASMAAAHVADLAGDGIVLDDGRMAKRAAGCLLRPATGDRVLIWRDIDGDVWVLSILLQADGTAAVLSPQHGAAIAIEAETVTVAAKRILTLSSGGDASLLAPHGGLALTAMRVSVVAFDHMVHTARNALAKAENWIVVAGQTIATRARHQVLAARKEMRIEGDRVQLS